MNTKILELIAVVDKNFNHIQQLETLSTLLREEKYKDELVVCMTTQNAHYDYRLFGLKALQIPENHIDTFLNQEWLAKKQIVCDDKSLIIVEDGHIINWNK